MKRIFILLMSAGALFAVWAVAALAWSTVGKTTWSGGQWHCGDSPNVTATAGTGWCAVIAPQTTEHGCGYRDATAKRSDNFQAVCFSDCPGWDGQQFPACCVKTTWVTQAIQYLVQACQSSNGPQSCGPTYGVIQGTFYMCGDTGPEGE